MTLKKIGNSSYLYAYRKDASLAAVVTSYAVDSYDAYQFSLTPHDHDLTFLRVFPEVEQIVGHD